MQALDETLDSSAVDWDAAWQLLSSCCAPHLESHLSETLSELSLSDDAQLLLAQQVGVLSGPAAFHYESSILPH